MVVCVAVGLRRKRDWNLLLIAVFVLGAMTTVITACLYCSDSTTLAYLPLICTAIVVGAVDGMLLNEYVLRRLLLVRTSLSVLIDILAVCFCSTFGVCCQGVSSGLSTSRYCARHIHHHRLISGLGHYRYNLAEPISDLYPCYCVSSDQVRLLCSLITL